MKDLKTYVNECVNDLFLESKLSSKVMELYNKIIWYAEANGWWEEERDEREAKKVLKDLLAKGIYDSKELGEELNNDSSWGGNGDWPSDIIDMINSAKKDIKWDEPNLDVYKNIDVTKPIQVNNDNIKIIIKQVVKKLGNNADLNFINVSKVTNMENLFQQTKFNGDISKWDVSNVKDMSYMFEYSEFNGDISNWDVSHVTNMSNMFEGSIFSGDISKWDVSKVNNMFCMFESSKFNQDISKWDVSNIEYMNYMFANSKFNQDISKWDVSNIENMICMFMDSEFNNNISDWDVSKVKYYEKIFDGCHIKDEYKPKFK